MATIDIPSLRALLAAATPGPWHADDGNICCENGSLAFMHPYANIRTVMKHNEEYSHADEALIVGAINALPELLDRLEVGAVENKLGEKTFHIVNTDNFGGDYPNESFVAQNIPSRELAEKMADSLNTNSKALRWYLVVEDGYVLQPGFEP